MSAVVCLLVDDTRRDRWRNATTIRPVLDFARVEGKRLGVKLYPAYTPTYGVECHVAQSEASLSKYSQGDGWYGPLSDETTKGLAARIRKEGMGFLVAEVLS